MAPTTPRPSAIVESTRQLLEETAPPFPPAPDDVPVGDLSNLYLVALRIGLSLGPLGARERELMAQVDAEIARRHEAAPAPRPAPAHPLATVAPRPFSELARRSYRLFDDVPRGYYAFLAATPYYHQRRRHWPRRSVRHRILCELRKERARERRALAVVTRLPAPLYDRAQVA